MCALQYVLSPARPAALGAEGWRRRGRRDAAGMAPPAQPVRTDRPGGRTCCRRTDACGPCVRRREAARRSRAWPDKAPPASTGVPRAGRPCAGGEPQPCSPWQRAQPAAARLHRPAGAGRRENRAKTQHTRSALISLNKWEWSDEKTGSGYTSKRSAQQTGRKAIDNQGLAEVEFPHARFINGIKTKRSGPVKRNPCFPTPGS